MRWGRFKDTPAGRLHPQLPGDPGPQGERAVGDLRRGGRHQLARRADDAGVVVRRDARASGRRPLRRVRLLAAAVARRLHGRAAARRRAARHARRPRPPARAQAASSSASRGTSAAPFPSSTSSGTPRAARCAARPRRCRARTTRCSCTSRRARRCRGRGRPARVAATCPVRQELTGESLAITFVGRADARRVGGRLRGGAGASPLTTEARQTALSSGASGSLPWGFALCLASSKLDPWTRARWLGRWGGAEGGLGRSGSLPKLAGTSRPSGGGPAGGLSWRRGASPRTWATRPPSQALRGGSPETLRMRTFRGPLPGLYPDRS